MNKIELQTGFLYDDRCENDFITLLCIIYLCLASFLICLILDLWNVSSEATSLIYLDTWLEV